MIEQKFCVICQQPITTKGAGRPRKTCSDACRQKAQRARVRAKGWRKREDDNFLRQGWKQLREYERRYGKLEERVAFRLSHLMPFLTCPTCGKPYVKLAWHGRPLTACCPEHTRIRRRLEDAARRAMARAREAGHTDAAGWIGQLLARKAPFRVCEECLEPFIPTGRRGRTPRYCSAACRRRHWEGRLRPCPVCGEAFDRRGPTGRYKKKFCSEKCQVKWNGWTRSDRQGREIDSGRWREGYGRGAPRTRQARESGQQSAVSNQQKQQHEAGPLRHDGLQGFSMEQGEWVRQPEGREARESNQQKQQHGAGTALNGQREASLRQRHIDKGRKQAAEPDWGPNVSAAAAKLRNAGIEIVMDETLSAVEMTEKLWLAYEQKVAAGSKTG